MSVFLPSRQPQTKESLTVMYVFFFWEFLYFKTGVGYFGVEISKKVNDDSDISTGQRDICTLYLTSTREAEKRKRSNANALTLV